MTENILTEYGVFCPLFHEKSTFSTNDLAKEYEKTFGTDAVFVADTQTGGRGRCGHTFLSPEGGLYASYLFHPTSPAERMHVTAAAAVAVAEALREMGVAPSIKWVNDVYIGGKKVAGILSEGAIENGKYRYAVVGIGINLADGCEKAGIADIATSVEAESGRIPDKTALLGRVLSRFLEALADDEKTMRLYRENCFVIGKDVEVRDGELAYPAYVKDMTQNGELLLKLPNGEEKTLCAGEVHIRVKQTK